MTLSVLYHPGNANKVVDALNRMTIGSVPHVDEYKKDLVKDVHRLARLRIRMEDSRVVYLWSIITLNRLWWLR